MSAKYGFVYIWRDRKHKRFYIGSHWGYENDGYICSSRWMRKAYQRRPDDFKRRIISRVYTNRKDAFIKEEYWLSFIKDEEIKTKYYNLHKSVHHWTMYPGTIKTVGNKIRLKALGRKASEETKTKMSEMRKGIQTCSSEHMEKLRQMKLGVARSEETKEKISQTLSGTILTEEHKQNLSDNNARYWSGKKRTEDSKRKMGMANLGNKYQLGRTHSEESKEKMRLAKLGKKLSPEHKEKISQSLKKETTHDP